MRVNVCAHVRVCVRPCVRVLVLAVVVGGVSHQPRADHRVVPRLISGLRLGGALSRPVHPELSPGCPPGPRSGGAHIKPVRYETPPYPGQGL